MISCMHCGRHFKEADELTTAATKSDGWHYCQASEYGARGQTFIREVERPPEVIEVDKIIEGCEITLLGDEEWGCLHVVTPTGRRGDFHTRGHIAWDFRFQGDDPFWDRVYMPPFGRIHRGRPNWDKEGVPDAAEERKLGTPKWKICEHFRGTPDNFVPIRD